MQTHERTRIGTDADVHARTRTYEDGRGCIMDLSLDYKAQGSWIGNACAPLFLMYGVSASL